MPSLLAVVVSSVPLSVLTSLTVALGIEAPFASLTVPVIVPNPACEYTWRAPAKTITALAEKTLIRRFLNIIFDLV
jgi:hypothetical protein